MSEPEVRALATFHRAIRELLVLATMDTEASVEPKVLNLLRLIFDATFRWKKILPDGDISDLPHLPGNVWTVKTALPSFSGSCYECATSTVSRSKTWGCSDAVCCWWHSGGYYWVWIQDLVCEYLIFFYSFLMCQQAVQAFGWCWSCISCFSWQSS